MEMTQMIDLIGGLPLLILSGGVIGILLRGLWTAWRLFERSGPDDIGMRIFTVVAAAVLVVALGYFILNSVEIFRDTFLGG